MKWNGEKCFALLPKVFPSCHLGSEKELNEGTNYLAIVVIIRLTLHLT